MTCEAPGCARTATATIEDRSRPGGERRYVCIHHEPVMPAPGVPLPEPPPPSPIVASSAERDIAAAWAVLGMTPVAGGPTLAIALREGVVLPLIAALDQAEVGLPLATLVAHATRQLNLQRLTVHLDAIEASASATGTYAEWLAFHTACRKRLL